MQAIEVLPVALHDDAIVAFRPGHAESFIVGWPAGARPDEVAARSMQRLGLAPIVLHSTSWRHSGDEVVLTYLAVVSPVAGPPPSWETIPVERAELARGDATGPPVSIGVVQVIEHGLRHLAWLVRDDPVIAATLPEWRERLAGYIPEPFRAFGPAAGPG